MFIWGDEQWYNQMNLPLTRQSAAWGRYWLFFFPGKCTISFPSTVSAHCALVCLWLRSHRMWRRLNLSSEVADAQAMDARSHNTTFCCSKSLPNHYFIVKYGSNPMVPTPTIAALYLQWRSSQLRARCRCRVQATLRKAVWAQLVPPPANETWY